jgi:hypothetical protein
MAEELPFQPTAFQPAGFQPTRAPFDFLDFTNETFNAISSVPTGYGMGGYGEGGYGGSVMALCVFTNETYEVSG